MKFSKTLKPPHFVIRLWAIWYRHFRVYTKNIFSNALPPFLEPLIFLAGMGLGIAKMIKEGDSNFNYIEFLASGLLVTSAMFTAAFECTYSTFVRLEFDKIYDGMLASPMKVRDLLLGEMLWAGTKGLFFSYSVLIVLLPFNLLVSPASLWVGLTGFCTGFLFAGFSLLITSFVKNINHFNFYMTGFLSPMFFFSGVFFPLKNLPVWLQNLAQALPLTHCVKLTRSLIYMTFDSSLWFSVLYMVLFTLLFSWAGIKRLSKRIID